VLVTPVLAAATSPLSGSGWETLLDPPRA
jgi:hypothetical protein